MAGYYDRGFDARTGLQLMGQAQALGKQMQGYREEQFEKEAFAVADLLSQDGDISDFSPKAKVSGARLHWDNLIKQGEAQRQKYLTSEAGMTDKLNKIKMNNVILNERWNQYNSLVKLGNIEGAKEVAMRMVNENMYNGYNVEKDGDDYYLKSLAEGTKQKITDASIEEITQFLGGYMGMSQDQIMEHSITAEQWRAKKNAEILSQAQPMMNDKGDIIYKVGPGTVDPVTGKYRGSFFVDVAGNEVPKDKVKGFKEVDIAEKSVDVRTKERALKTPDIVNPTGVVSQEGKPGLITQKGGDIKFEEIPGGLDTSSIPGGSGGGGGVSADEKRAFDLMVKRMETELEPFAEPGKQVIDPDTLEITHEGKNALRAAMKIVQKYQDDPKSLDKSEMELLNNAIRAVQIYQSISESNRRAFGLEKNPAAAMQSGKPQPPPGFKLD